MVYSQLAQSGVSGKTIPGTIWAMKVLDPSHPSAAGLPIDVPDSVSSNVACSSHTEIYHLDQTVQKSNPGAITDVSFIVGPLTDSTAPSVRSQEQLGALWETLVVGTKNWNFLILIDSGAGIIHTLKYVDLSTTIRTGGFIVSNNGIPTADDDVTAEMLMLFEMQTYNAVARILQPANDVAKARMTYHGSTLEFSASITTDMGEAITVELAPEWKDIESDNIAGRGTFTLRGLTTLGTTATTRLRTFRDTLPQVSPKAFSCVAREGFYAPASISDPNFYFRDVLGQEALNIEGNHVDYVNAFFSLMAGSPTMTSTLNSLGAISLPVFLPDRFAFQSTAASFTGLSPQATFKLTLRYGMAVQPNPGSLLAYYSLPSCKRDQDAIDLAIDIRQELDDAYPSSYNFLDKLWGVIKGIAKPIIGIGKKLLPEAVGLIPGVGSFLKPLVGGLLDRFGTNSIQDARISGSNAGISGLPPWMSRSSIGM
jgi:hypothetical protein